MRKLVLLMVFGFEIFNVRAQVCFAPSIISPLAAGSSLQSLISADFNADGKNDLVTANEGNNTVSVLLGNGTGNFAPATNFTVGNSPRSITSADFNGDSKLDLAVANYAGNTLSVLLGNGAGSFASASNFSVGTQPVSITSADFNGDGFVDLASANYNSNDVSILLGNGAGSFSLVVTMAVGGYAYSLTNADFNADGKADLAVANFNTNNVSILLGNGLGNFAPAVNFGVGTWPYSVISADFNTDGKIDLATANNNSNNVSILFGNGAGGFAPMVNFGVGTGPYALTSADINADGKVDLVTANINSNNISILLGNGVGSFASAVNFASVSGPISVASADFNGDGNVDVASANANNSNVSVLLNLAPSITVNASSTFVCAGASITLTAVGATTYTWTGGVSNGVVFTPPTGLTTYTVSGTDINGCAGKAVANVTVNALPLITASAAGTVVCAGTSVTLTSSGATTYTWSANAGGVVATSAVVTPTVTTNYTVSGTDVNGCINSANVTQSVGGCSAIQNIGLCLVPSSTSPFTVGNIPLSITSSDFNADGYVDLAVANNNSVTISVLLGNGVGDFSPAATLSVGISPSSVISADFNGDGTADLAVANRNNSNAVSVLLGNGTGNFSAPVYFAVGLYPISLTTADFNGDGYADLAVTNDFSNNVSVLIGNGSGSFAPAVNFNVGMNPYSITSADFNADGKTDLAVANYGTGGTNSNIVSLLIGSGTGSFAPAVNFTVGYAPRSVISGDFNTDGKADLATANTGSNDVTILFGNGAGSFSPAVSLLAGTLPFSVVSSDFNADGTADLAVANYGTNNVSVLLGNGAGNFASAINFAVGISPSFLISADLDTDGKADLAVANANTNNVSVLLSTLPQSITAITTSSVVCSGTSITLTGGGVTTYTWSGGVSNGVAFIPMAGSTTYTVTGTDFNNCTNSQTISVTVNSTCADVWPGDANSDGVADNLDVLELGLHYTQSGPLRASTNNTWQSYFANNWTGSITNGSNLNHSDCNGDGIINDNDTLAIYNNYGLTHTFKTAQTTTVNPQLSIVSDQAFVAKGTWGTASIYLGDAATNITNINGVAFTVNFDNTLIEPSNVWIEYQNSFIDASSNLYFRKLDFANSKLYTASTHTVSNNVSGFGKIATLHYQILSSLATDQVLNIGLSQANQSNASGVITPLTTGTGTLMAIGTSVGIKESFINGSVLISPNPTNGILNISFNAIPQNTKIELYNSIGALVLTEVMSNKNNTINVSELSSGMYFMKVLEGNKVVAVKKVVKE